MTARLGDMALHVRSKNAGPFQLTIDIFCGSEEVCRRVCRGLDNAEIAVRLGVATSQLKRFDLVDLHAIKLSLPRQPAQGSIKDRDMHGAAFARLLDDIVIG